MLICAPLSRSLRVVGRAKHTPREIVQTGMRQSGQIAMDSDQPSVAPLALGNPPPSTTSPTPADGLTFTLNTLRREDLTPEDHIALREARLSFNIRFSGSQRRAWENDSTLSDAVVGFSEPSISSAERLNSKESKVTLIPGFKSGEEKFPRWLQGFLYYWSPPPPISPLAGQINFRLTRSNDPTSFEHGRDYYLRRHGLRWRLPLLTIAWAEGYEPLREQLLQERLVDVETMDFAQALGKEYKLKRNHSRVVHSFYQPFTMDLGTHNYTLYFLGRANLHRSLLHNFYAFKGTKVTHQTLPFVGKLLCCFEPYSDNALRHLPWSSRSRKIAMRVLRVLEPVAFAENYKGPRNIPPPAAGELVRTYTRKSKPGTVQAGHTIPGRISAAWTVWSVDADRQREMQVLFEHQNLQRGQVHGREGYKARLKPTPLSCSSIFHPREYDGQYLATTCFRVLYMCISAVADTSMSILCTVCVVMNRCRCSLNGVNELEV
ncbi:hypothetical protein BV20DRAFT_1006215 [Pilatotrama ljubarskyi]|nr:hypothetical protein BV20DRAFT_1006215 [Pilatotrama ljubarskyi]